MENSYIMNETDKSKNEECAELSHTFNIEEAIDLKNEIETSLTKGDFIEIFKLIRKDGVKYSENKNGIFINMNKLKPETMEDIKKFVAFTKKNKTNFENDNMLRENMKELMNKTTTNDITINSPSFNTNDNTVDNDVTSQSYDTNIEYQYNISQEAESITFNNQNVPILSNLENELSGLTNSRFDKTKLYEKKKNINT